MNPPYYLEPSLPAGLDSYQELVWHLHRLPGGAQAAVPDFFAALLAGAPQARAWRLASGGLLELNGDDALLLDGEEITRAPAALRKAAEEGGASPLALVLLSMALGYLEGERRLKVLAPGLRAAAKDLMLMTVCRLCG